MGSHDDYGKRVLLRATNGNVIHYGPPVKVYLGAGIARIDGVVGGDIAIEVESRTSKQVRGAVLDLICHPYPKKLLLLLPVHMNNPQEMAEQCQHIMARFLPPMLFRVLLLRGSGNDPHEEQDAILASDALAELGYKSSAKDAVSRDSPTAPHSIRLQEAASLHGRIGGKYDGLEHFLSALPIGTREVSLTFQQIEGLLGFELPTSARKYREWWSNQSDISARPQTRAWTNAGFRVEAVRQHGEDFRVSFMRQPT